MTTPSPKKIEEKALGAIGEYLKSVGWKPLVIGFDSIEQGNLKYNFRLIVKFTGKK